MIETALLLLFFGAVFFGSAWVLRDGVEDGLIGWGTPWDVEGRHESEAPPLGGARHWTRHMVQEGSRQHVIWWDHNGSHCTEENCEVNRPRPASLRAESQERNGD